MRKGQVFLGILVGASAGALLGLLFAPLAGKETRKNITKASKKYAESLKGEFNDTLNDLTKKYNKVKAEVSDLAHQARVKEERLKKESGM